MDDAAERERAMGRWRKRGAAGALALLAACAGVGAPREAVPLSPPAPPPVIADPILICVLENGVLTNVPVRYNTATGDTIVGGRPFSEVYPATAEYAATRAWYVNNEPVILSGRSYVKYGLPRILGRTEVDPVYTFQGVPVFAEAGATGVPEVVYLPVRPGCEFQPYQVAETAGAVRGE